MPRDLGEPVVCIYEREDGGFIAEHRDYGRIAYGGSATGIKRLLATVAGWMTLGSVRRGVR